MTLKNLALGCFVAWYALPLRASIIIGSDQDRMRLGSAFDPDTQRFSDVCVDGPIVRSSGRRGIVETVFASDFSHMKLTIDKLASAGVDVGIVSASESLEYNSRVSKTDLRESLMITFQIQDDSVRFLPVIDFGPLGRRMLDESSLFERRRRCGTEFVQQIDLGYRLNLALVLNFKDHQSYERYKKTVKVKALFGLISHTETTIKELSSMDRTATFEVLAMQEGGDETRLRNLVNKKSRCTVDDVAECIAVFKEIFAYAQAPRGADGFADEMDAAARRSYLERNGPAILRYVTASYSNSGLDGLNTEAAASTRTEAIRAQKKEMEEALQEQRSHEQRASALLFSADPDSKRALERQKTDILQNIATLSATLRACESTYDEEACLEKGHDALQTLLPVNKTVLYGAE